MASLEARGHDPSESGLVMGDRPCLASNINNTLGEHLRILYIIYIYIYMFSVLNVSMDLESRFFSNT